MTGEAARREQRFTQLHDRVRNHLERAEYQLEKAENLAADPSSDLAAFDIRLRLGTLHSQLAGSLIGYWRVLQ